MADVRGNGEHLFGLRDKGKRQKPAGTGNTEPCYEHSRGRKMGTEEKENEGEKSPLIYVFVLQLILHEAPFGFLVSLLTA